MNYCPCGKAEIISQEPDYEIGQYYIIIECEDCGYYEEGYTGTIE